MQAVFGVCSPTQELLNRGIEWEMELEDVPNAMVEICIGYAGAIGVKAMVEIAEAVVVTWVVIQIGQMVPRNCHILPWPLYNVE